eukprot:12880305-Alexandrium_andersonii.AAC.1
MGSVMTEASSIPAAGFRPGSVAPASVASSAAGSRAGSVSVRERRPAVPRIDERSLGESWMDMSQEGHPGEIP